jgi:hypothetical protein
MLSFFSLSFSPWPPLRHFRFLRLLTPPTPPLATPRRHAAITPRHYFQLPLFLSHYAFTDFFFHCAPLRHYAAIDYFAAAMPPFDYFIFIDTPLAAIDCFRHFRRHFRHLPLLRFSCFSSRDFPLRFFFTPFYSLSMLPLSHFDDSPHYYASAAADFRLALRCWPPPAPPCFHYAARHFYARFFFIRFILFSIFSPPILSLLAIFTPFCRQNRFSRQPLA